MAQADVTYLTMVDMDKSSINRYSSVINLTVAVPPFRRARP